MGSLLREGEAPAEPGRLRSRWAEAARRGQPRPPNRLALRSESSRSHLGTWFAVAASVVVAFGLGRQSGVMRSASEPASQRRSLSAPAVPNDKADSPRLERAARGDAVTLVVNDRDGVPQRIEVPLVEGRQLGQAFGDVPHWSSPELDPQLDEHGLDLDARRRYAPIYLSKRTRLCRWWCRWTTPSFGPRIDLFIKHEIRRRRRRDTGPERTARRSPQWNDLGLIQRVERRNGSSCPLACRVLSPASLEA